MLRSRLTLNTEQLIANCEPPWKTKEEKLAQIVCLPERINFSEECTMDLAGWNTIMHYLFYIRWLESVINCSLSLTMAMAGPMIHQIRVTRMVRSAVDVIIL